MSTLINILNSDLSIALLIDLLKQGLYGCGTVRTLVKKGLGKRGSKVLQHGNITTTVWQVNKPVPVISSDGDPTTPNEVLQRNRDGI